MNEPRHRIDDRLAAAASDLRTHLDDRELPDFTPNRRAAPAVLALVLLLGIGVAGFVASMRVADTASIEVATQPEVPDNEQDPPGSSEIDESNERAASPEPAERPTVAESSGPEEGDTTGPSGVPASVEEPRVGQLGAAGPGEFFVPLSEAAAWTADESKLLVYRTGAAQPGYALYDTATGEVVAEPAISPPDIEQVYAHPSDPDQILFAQGAALMSYSIENDRSTQVVRFAGCDRVDSGVLPVAPSPGGIVSLLCHSESGVEQVVYDLVAGTELRAGTVSDTAAFPSQSGTAFVRWNDDGTGSVLDAGLVETGVVLDLQGNLFAMTTTDDGREWASTTLFSGPWTGTVVLLPLDGVGTPQVRIGPSVGDPSPPSGTRIATVGSTIFVSTNGPDDGALAGRVVAVDADAVEGDTGTRWSVPNDNADLHDYWSSNFVAPSPSGRFVAYSSDFGTGQVDTTIVAVADEQQ